jgi:hypothetical protein
MSLMVSRICACLSFGLDHLVFKVWTLVFHWIGSFGFHSMDAGFQRISEKLF